MPSEHREKAVEAIVRHRVNVEEDEGRAVNDHREHEHRERARRDLQAADDHLKRMYFERFQTLLLGAFRVAATNATASKTKVAEAERWLDTALDKAQEIMEEGGDGR